jgi:ATP-dependent DNA helicase RecQ
VRRLALAQERGVPAYVIFTDKTLVDMAYRKPQSTADFLDVNGVGKSKTDKFSKPFIEVISDYLVE